MNYYSSKLEIVIVIDVRMAQRTQCQGIVFSFPLVLTLQKPISLLVLQPFLSCVCAFWGLNIGGLVCRHLVNCFIVDQTLALIVPFWQEEVKCCYDWLVGRVGWGGRYLFHDGKRFRVKILLIVAKTCRSNFG